MKDNHWMVTFTGKKFWPLAPEEDAICIDDIAHALSNICRFGGHCQKFYSVAQHSVLVSRTCAYKDALWGLLHDAAEAYMGDIIRPIKKHENFSDLYRQTENAIMAQIGRKFCLKIGMPESVKYADEVVLLTEKRDLVVPHDYVWTDVQISRGGAGLTPLLRPIVPVGPDLAKVMFINRFIQLNEELNGQTI